MFQETHDEIAEATLEVDSCESYEEKELIRELTYHDTGVGVSQNGGRGNMGASLDGARPLSTDAARLVRQ